MKKIICLITIAVITILTGCKKQVTDENVKLFYNGEILTMEGDEPTYAEAIVSDNGKISFIGVLKEAEDKYPNATKIDLENHTMLPGFVDSHSHLAQVINTMGQVDLSSPPVGTVKNFNDIVQKLVNFKKENNIKDGQWIFGWGYDETQLEEQQHITKKELDEVLPNNPVYIQHTSGHMGIANSAALKIANIDANTKNPEGGMIVRYPNSNEPTGLVQEVAMYYFAGTAIQELASKKPQLFAKALDYYIENGVTTAQEGLTDPQTMEFLMQEAKNNKLKIDIVSLLGDFHLGKALEAPFSFKEYNNGLKFEGIKIVADGSPQGKTAYFTKPYLTQVPGCDKDCKGFPNINQEELDKIFTTAYKNHQQLFVHSNGDASMDMIIKAHENACKATNQALDEDRRTIVIHSQFIRPDQLETYKKYNLMPSFFSNHAFFWGDVHVENLGEERAFFLSPMKAANALGLTFSNHTDCIVTPINQLFTVWTAVNRVSRSGKVIGEEQKVSPYIALKAITINAAKQIFDEDLKGSLKEGKLADFVILSENPLKVEPMKIKDIEVLETIKEGISVYKK